MTKAILTTIGDINIINNSLILTIGFPNLNDRIYLKELDVAQIKKALVNTKITVNSEEVIKEFTINEVDVSSSIADFKNVFIKTDLNNKTKLFKEGDSFFLSI